MLRRYFPLVIGLLACLGSGCADVSEVREPVELQAPTASVPVVYDERLRPARLTSQQMDGILSEAVPFCPKGQHVWFIWVHDNFEFSGELYCNATVYFTPTMVTSRIRKGQSIGFWQDVSSFSKRLGRPVKTREDLSDYCQVALREKPFGQELDVPAGTLMPFAPPKGFADDEVVEIVDFIRTNPKKTEQPEVTFVRSEGDTYTVYHRPVTFDGSQPILSIERKNGTIEVRAGTVQRTWAGAGQMLRLIEAPEGFKVLEIFLWVS